MNLPIPSPGSCRQKYRFDDLEIDQSRVFPIELALSVRVRACNFGKKTGRKLATRVMKDGIRVWRIA